MVICFDDYCRLFSHQCEGGVVAGMSVTSDVLFNALVYWYFSTPGIVVGCCLFACPKLCFD